MRGIQELFEIVQGAVGRINGEIVSDIIPVVLKGRRVERKKPDCSDAKIFEIIQFAQQSLKISDAIIIRVAKGFDVQLIDNGFLEPEWSWRLYDFGGLGLGCLNLHKGSFGV
jgi:hypothetical protein